MNHNIIQVGNSVIHFLLQRKVRRLKLRGWIWKKTYFPTSSFEIAQCFGTIIWKNWEYANPLNFILYSTYAFSYDREKPVIHFLFCRVPNLHGQHLGFTLTNGKKNVQIPIEIINNLVVIPVVLNGALPLKFILDTGVRTTILTQKTFTDILNLEYTRKYTISGPGGQNLVDAYVTNNVSIDLPGVSGKGHAMLVLAQDYLELRNYLGTDVHGILGYELFSRFIIEIDYQKKLLTLMTPERFHKRQ